MMQRCVCFRCGGTLYFHTKIHCGTNLLVKLIKWPINKDRCLHFSNGFFWRAEFWTRNSSFLIVLDNNQVKPTSYLARVSCSQNNKCPQFQCSPKAPKAPILVLSPQHTICSQTAFGLLATKEVWQLQISPSFQFFFSAEEKILSI